MNTESHIDCKQCKNRYKSIFCDLKEEEVDVLSLGKACKTYKKGEEIFTQGTPPKGIFIINAGKVKISRLADSGNEQIVKMVNSGEILGYRALLSNEMYSSSAVALEVTSICFLPRHLFFRFIEQNATLAGALLKIAASDLKHTERKLVDLSQKTARERIAEALLYLKEIYGYEQDQTTINVILTRGDIANIAGTTRETSIRVLAGLKKDKIIDFSGKSIKVKDFPGLVSLANISD
ncbi:MAG: Crp/Fnr family transcriptional regulator [Bacteroidia bacterium]|nr:Crp/Fnr family transcriptional regulator [Bacteroidia bacterium]